MSANGPHQGRARHYRFLVGLESSCPGHLAPWANAAGPTNHEPRNTPKPTPSRSALAIPTLGQVAWETLQCLFDEAKERWFLLRIERGTAAVLQTHAVEWAELGGRCAILHEAEDSHQVGVLPTSPSPYQFPPLAVGPSDGALVGFRVCSGPDLGRK